MKNKDKYDLSKLNFELTYDSIKWTLKIKTEDKKHNLLVAKYGKLETILVGLQGWLEESDGWEEIEKICQ